MNASFVIYFHSVRTSNLNQCLRLLWQLHPEVHSSEIVLVCQDLMAEQVKSPFEDTVILEMKLDTYHKPLMCNAGVRQAKNDLVVILDSDRVLPAGYFSNVFGLIKPADVVTSLYLWSLVKEVDDELFTGGKFVRVPDHRKQENEPGRKNMFSGNTTIWKDDYLRIGGMDEGYVGYGFADNDMTRAVEMAGMNCVYIEANEYHLWHANRISWNGRQIDRSEYRAVCAANGLRYCRKWSLQPNDYIKGLVTETVSRLLVLPDDIRSKFTSEYKVRM
jgi:hypothetical protein